MASEAKHTPEPRYKLAGPCEFGDYSIVPFNEDYSALAVACVLKNGGEPSGAVKERAEEFLTAVNAYPTLLAERDAALVAVEGVRAALLPPDTKEQIAGREINVTRDPRFDLMGAMGTLAIAIESGPAARKDVLTCLETMGRVLKRIENAQAALSSLPTAQVKQNV